MSTWLFNSMHGTLRIQEIETKIGQPKAIVLFVCVRVCVWETAHFSCWPLTFIEGSDLERFASECCKVGFSFFFLSVVSVYVRVCFNSASHCAVWNHMMTLPDEVTLNKEPALIITFVLLSDWLHSVQKKAQQKRKKNTMMFCLSIFSQEVAVTTQS